jgi:hypothetical protein
MGFAGHEGAGQTLTTASPKAREIRSVVIIGKSLLYPFDLSLRLAVWSNKRVSIAILTTVLLKACF